MVVGMQRKSGLRTALASVSTVWCGRRGQRRGSSLLGELLQLSQQSSEVRLARRPDPARAQALLGHPHDSERVGRVVLPGGVRVRDALGVTPVGETLQATSHRRRVVPVASAISDTLRLTRRSSSSACATTSRIVRSRSHVDDVASHSFPGLRTHSANYRHAGQSRLSGQGEPTCPGSPDASLRKPGAGPVPATGVTGDWPSR
jgi:hypothetical protein